MGPIRLINIVDHLFDEGGNAKSECLGFPPIPDQEAICNYLGSGLIWMAAASLQPCEICKEWAGPRTYCHDGRWYWPKYMIHHIERHGLKVPEAFLQDIRANRYRFPTKAAEFVLSVPQERVQFVMYEEKS